MKADGVRDMFAKLINIFAWFLHNSRSSTFSRHVYTENTVI